MPFLPIFFQSQQLMSIKMQKVECDCHFMGRVNQWLGDYTLPCFRRREHYKDDSQFYSNVVTDIRDNIPCSCYYLMGWMNASTSLLQLFLDVFCIVILYSCNFFFAINQESFQLTQPTLHFALNAKNLSLFMQVYLIFTQYFSYSS